MEAEQGTRAMGVLEILQAIDSLKPNAYPLEEKLAWLSTLDGLLHEEVLKAHEGSPPAFAPYEGQEALERKLLAPEPYGRQLYLTWLESRMDYYNGDTERFNNSLAQFRGAYSEFSRHYNRTHRPIGATRKFW